jgi:hypothetical protein
LIDLRDARIVEARIDEAAGTVTIEVAPAGGSKKVELFFEGVRSLPLVAQGLKLARGPGAGNILDWKPAFSGGNTFIYLLDGVISIWSQRLSVKEL